MAPRLFCAETRMHGAAECGEAETVTQTCAIIHAAVFACPTWVAHKCIRGRGAIRVVTSLCNDGCQTKKER